MSNNIRLEITNKILELESIKNKEKHNLENIIKKSSIRCIDPECINEIEKEHFLTKVNNYYYIFCSRKCWNKYLYNKNDISYKAQFTNNLEYDLFLEKFNKKNRDYCFNYSRNYYCFIGL